MGYAKVNNKEISSGGDVVYTQSNLAINGNNGNVFIANLTESAQLTLSNIVQGKVYKLYIKATTKDIFVVLTGSNYIIPNTFDKTILLGKTLKLTFFYDGTNYYFNDEENSKDIDLTKQEFIYTTVYGGNLNRIGAKSLTVVGASLGLTYDFDVNDTYGYIVQLKNTPRTSYYVYSLLDHSVVSGFPSSTVGTIYSVKFSEDGQRLVVGGSTGYMVIDVATKSVISGFEQVTDVRNAMISPDNNWIAIITNSGNGYRVVDYNTKLIDTGFGAGSSLSARDRFGKRTISWSADSLYFIMGVGEDPWYWARINITAKTYANSTSGERLVGGSARDANYVYYNLGNQRLRRIPFSSGNGGEIYNLNSAPIPATWTGYAYPVGLSKDKSKLYCACVTSSGGAFYIYDLISSSLSGYYTTAIGSPGTGAGSTTDGQFMDFIPSTYLLNL